MATEAQQPLKLSLPASAALGAAVVAQNAAAVDVNTVGSLAQYLFVKRDTAGRAIVCTSASDVPVGVLQNKPTAIDQMCEIVVIGITKAITTTSGTAFSTFNDGVAPYTDGSAQKATPIGWGASYVQGTKSVVGKIGVIGGTGQGLPAANDTTRIIINCASAPTPGT